MRLVTCPVGTKGFDTAAKLTSQNCTDLRAAGFEFAVRYLSLGAPNAGDLTGGEIASIHNAGLGLMVVQHVLYPGWHPDAHLGAQLGTAAYNHAQMLGLPPGMILWCDLETPSPTATPDDVAQYENAWSTAVRSHGFDPGGYVGAGLPLSAAQLQNLSVRRYWESDSLVLQPSRGWQMCQLFDQVTHCGVGVDVNYTRKDYRGDLPTMIVP
jgi:hypothetical protein